MGKFDSIKMLELLEVIDPNDDGGITMKFQENKTLKISIKDNTLISEFVD